MVEKKTSVEELEKRIRTYKKRMGKRNIPKIPFNEEGLYRIVSGTTNEFESREEYGLIKGRFIDIVADLVSSNGYFGWYCTEQDHDNNAYLKRAEISEIKPLKSLDELLEKII